MGLLTGQSNKSGTPVTDVMPSIAAGGPDISSLAAQFARDGYVVDRGVVAGAELEALRAEASALIERFVEGGDPYVVVTDGRPWKLNFVTDPARRQLNESVGLLAAHPRIIAMVQAIIGPRLALVMQSMTFKHRAGGAAVPRHRDTFVNVLERPQAHVVLNADIYLDDATLATGCLRVAPGSHLQKDVRDLVEVPLDHWDDLVPVEVRAGDVAYHNDLTVHGSPATPPHDGSGVRRLVLNVYVDPEMLATEGFVPGMVPIESVVQNHVAALRYWVERRRAAYGDVDYTLAPWDRDHGGDPILDPAGLGY